MTADALTQEYQRREGHTTIGRQAKLCSPGEFCRLSISARGKVRQPRLSRLHVGTFYRQLPGLEQREGNLRGSASSGLPIEQQQVVVQYLRALEHVAFSCTYGSYKTKRKAPSRTPRRSGTSKGSGITSHAQLMLAQGRGLFGLSILKGSGTTSQSQPGKAITQDCKMTGLPFSLPALLARSNKDIP